MRLSLFVPLFKETEKITLQHNIFHYQENIAKLFVN
jgi:hypothetical protein